MPVPEGAPEIERKARPVGPLKLETFVAPLANGESSQPASQLGMYVQALGTGFGAQFAPANVVTAEVDTDMARMALFCESAM